MFAVCEATEFVVAWETTGDFCDEEEIFSSPACFVLSWSGADNVGRGPEIYNTAYISYHTEKKEVTRMKFGASF